MALEIPEDDPPEMKKSPIKKIPVDPRRQAALKKRMTPHEQHMNHLNHVNHMRQNVAKTNVNKSGFKFNAR